jgi:hypothetical protein
MQLAYYIQLRVMLRVLKLRCDSDANNNKEE